MKIIYIILALLFSVNNVFAKNSADIFTGSSTSSVVFSEAYNNSKVYRTVFGTAIGYGHAFSNGFELGTSVSLVIQTGIRDLTLIAGPSYNFNSADLENSFFTGVKGGIIYTYNWGYTLTNGIASADIGKRFKLAEGISYSPSIEVVSVFDSLQNNPTISLHIFKFSVIF